MPELEDDLDFEDSDLAAYLLGIPTEAELDDLADPSELALAFEQAQQALVGQGITPETNEDYDLILESMVKEVLTGGRQRQAQEAALQRQRERERATLWRKGIGDLLKLFESAGGGLKDLISIPLLQAYLDKRLAAQQQFQKAEKEEERKFTKERQAEEHQWQKELKAAEHQWQQELKAAERQWEKEQKALEREWALEKEAREAQRRILEKLLTSGRDGFRGFLSQARREYRAPQPTRRLYTPGELYSRMSPSLGTAAIAEQMGLVLRPIRALPGGNLANVLSPSALMVAPAGMGLGANPLQEAIEAFESPEQQRIRGELHQP